MGIYTPNSPYPFFIRPQSPNPRIRRPEDATLARYGDLKKLYEKVSIVDITSSGIYNLSVNGKLSPGTRYRITDYKSVNWLHGYDNAETNNPPTYIPAFSPYAPVNSNLGPGATGGSVLHIATDPTSSAIYVCGSFNDINGSLPTFFQKLNADGTADSTFNSNYVGTSPSPGFDGRTRAAAVQPDGKVVVGGDFTLLDSVTRNRLVRFNANGIIDTVFSTNLGTAFDDIVYAIVIQSDGKILVGGKFANFNGNARNGLVRLNADGTEDTTFATNIGAAAGVGGEVREILISQTGKIYLIGAFLNWNGNANTLNIARLNSNGTFDNTFASGLAPGQKGLTAIHELSNGDIILSGTSVPDTWNLVVLTSYVFRVSSTGAMVNAGWGNVTGSHAHTFTTLSTGEVVVGGSKTTVCDGYSVIAVYSEAGVKNNIYNPGSSFDSDVLSLAVIGNDQYLMCGGSATLQYQGNAAPETLIALNLSTVGPYQARAVHVSDPEVLVVTAASGSELDPIGYSETYGDVVSYIPYFNAHGLVIDIFDGKLLPNGQTVAGFNVQWDSAGQYAYIIMPQDYPVQFGNYFYIYWSGLTGSGFYFIVEPIKPGINYSLEYSVNQSNGSVEVSPDGYTVKIYGITYNQFLDINTASFYVETIEKLNPGYGFINWRKDFTHNNEATFDWRNYRFRRYEVDTSNIAAAFNELLYIGTTDTEWGGTTGNYIDLPPIMSGQAVQGLLKNNPFNFYLMSLNVQLLGAPGYLAYYYYAGTIDNLVVPYCYTRFSLSAVFVNNSTIGYYGADESSFNNVRIGNSAFTSMYDCTVNGLVMDGSYIRSASNSQFNNISIVTAYFNNIVNAQFLPNAFQYSGDYSTSTALSTNITSLVLRDSTNSGIVLRHDGTNFVVIPW